MANRSPGNSEQRSAFATEAGQARPSLLRELWEFLNHTKKWWLLPIVIVLLLAGLLIMLSGTALAPFIYPLF